MNVICSQLTATMDELKKNPKALLEEAEGEVVTIFDHNIPTAYLVPADVYEALMEDLENYKLSTLAQKRQSEDSDAIDVSIDEL